MNKSTTPPTPFHSGEPLSAVDLNRIVDSLARRILGGKGVTVGSIGQDMLVEQNLAVRNGHVPWRSILVQAKEAIAQGDTGTCQRLNDDLSEAGPTLEAHNLGAEVEADEYLLVHKVGNKYFFHKGGTGGGGGGYVEVFESTDGPYSSMYIGTGPNWETFDTYRGTKGCALVCISIGTGGCTMLLTDDVSGTKTNKQQLLSNAGVNYTYNLPVPVDSNGKFYYQTPYGTSGAASCAMLGWWPAISQVL